MELHDTNIALTPCVIRQLTGEQYDYNYVVDKLANPGLFF